MIKELTKNNGMPSGLPGKTKIKRIKDLDTGDVVIYDGRERIVGNVLESGIGLHHIGCDGHKHGKIIIGAGSLQKVEYLYNVHDKNQSK